MQPMKLTAALIQHQIMTHAGDWEGSGAQRDAFVALLKKLRIPATTFARATISERALLIGRVLEKLSHWDGTPKIAHANSLEDITGTLNIPMPADLPQVLDELLGEILREEEEEKEEERRSRPNAYLFSSLSDNEKLLRLLKEVNERGVHGFLPVEREEMKRFWEQIFEAAFVSLTQRDREAAPRVLVDLSTKVADGAMLSWARRWKESNDG